MRKLRRLIAVMIAAALAPAALLAQEAATVSGRVTNAQGQPEPSVLVRIESLNVGAPTGADGTYRLVVPGARLRAGQSVQITATRAGLARVTRTVTLSPGANLTQNFEMTAQIILLEDVVVTGVAGETPVTKLPIVVERLSAEDMPVPSTTAGGMIQGKVAGASVVTGSGLPGQAPSILLRGPTSINTQGRNQDPLYIVDGVILGSGLADIDANDIENIEIVKGAAAASLYGSRAANGVVQITTKSGRRLGANTTRYTFRQEIGRSDLPGSIPLLQSHQFQLNAAGTAFVDVAGNEFDWNEQVRRRSAGLNFANPVERGTSDWNRYIDQPWPGQTYNHVDAVFRRGDHLQSTMSIEGSQGNTNYHASFGRLDQSGVMFGQQGYQRNFARLNLDQGLGTNLVLSMRGYFSRANQDGQGAGSAGGTPLFTLTRMPAGTNLMQRDSLGRILIFGHLTGENANPLYELDNLVREDQRDRFLGGANLRWSPLSWFDLDGNVSYDRSGVQRYQFFFRGFKTARPTASINNGNIYRDNWVEDAYNASATATFRRSFGDLNTRMQARYLTERSDYDYLRASGTDLVVVGIPNLNAASDNQITRSSESSIRSEGYFLIGNLDFRDRYILDALIRRDGSSLFGANERWQTYYRLAAAWRVSEEPFWGVGGVEDLKLRYSVGTAGGRPNFSAQYETFPLTDGTLGGGGTVGNPDLRPEFAIEQEMGVDVRLANRFDLSVTYATSEVRDQILNVPLPAASGFNSQWRNAGTLESNTWEASLDASLIERGNFSWSSRLLYDRTRQTITELDRAPYQYGFPNQGISAVFYARPGEALGTFYGTRWATSCGDLPSGTDCSQFTTNSDGYFVWVGNSNTGGGAGPDGVLGTADDLWGTTGPAVRGLAVHWGTPIVAQDADGETFLRLGKTTPDFSMGFSNTFTMGAVSLFALFEGTFGVDVYNNPRHWAYFERLHGDLDQAGLPDSEKKPVGYYAALYRSLDPPNSHFVEDGGFVKLREMSLRYAIPSSALGRLPMMRGTERLALSVIGRNLYSWDNYSGYDPEVGFGGGDTGSASIARFDGFNYPNFRTLTLGIELGF
jgi:TonB-linked SusC/RagA family outer membrane protein